MFEHSVLGIHAQMARYMSLLLLITVIAHQVMCIDDKHVQDGKLVQLTRHTGNCGQNPQYFFMHMHKAGGATLNHELRKELLGDSFFIASESSVKIGLNKSYFCGKLPRMMIIIREPLGRVVSHYNQAIASGLYNGSINNYMGKSTIHDLQYKKLGGHIEMLNEFWFVGVTGFYAESFCLLLWKLGKWDMEKCSCSKEVRGTETHHDHGVDHSLTAENFPEELRKGFWDRNIHEQEVYLCALKIFLKAANKAQEKDVSVDVLCDSRARLINEISEAESKRTQYASLL